MCRSGNLLSSKSGINVAYAAFFCLLLSSLYGSLIGQPCAGRTLGTVFPHPVKLPPNTLRGNRVGGMFKRDQEHTTMNNKFNSANPCTPKYLAKQLLIASAKLLSQQQCQALLDIYKTLDVAEKNHATQNLPNLISNKSHRSTLQDEFNQEYWSGEHYDGHDQTYPSDWVKRTQQRPHFKFFKKSNSSL